MPGEGDKSAVRLRLRLRLRLRIRLRLRERIMNREEDKRALI